MIFAIIGLIIGLLIGFVLNFTYAATFTIYITLIILILIQSLLRIIKNEDMNFPLYKEAILIGSEIAFACLLAYIGEKLGISLYLAIVLSFGLRIFNDFNIIVKKVIKYDKIN
jgi:small basic protein